MGGFGGGDGGGLTMIAEIERCEDEDVYWRRGGEDGAEDS